MRSLSRRAHRVHSRIADQIQYEVLTGLDAEIVREAIAMIERGRPNRDG